MTAIEQTGHYRGKYFVLMGTLSPIDGVGPEELGIDVLLTRCKEGVSEVILAVSSSVEGEATAHYISELIKLRHQGVADRSGDSSRRRTRVGGRWNTQSRH